MMVKFELRCTDIRNTLLGLFMLITSDSSMFLNLYANCPNFELESTVKVRG